ncbi:hypothetical protein WICPIJ_007608 [Wickerhamomyces pijperi]|uniref:Uncharacterized protein n=1 Tax=Wickerhamomyces pijperi TaxID=599730 RepID=A0A9P8TJT0_WICPI|nr:hypothetical protein WICPIJ_007608 [Wickerhamomyces pijperi]
MPDIFKLTTRFFRREFILLTSMISMSKPQSSMDSTKASSLSLALEFTMNSPVLETTEMEKSERKGKSLMAVVMEEAQAAQVMPEMMASTLYKSGSSGSVLDN